MTLVYNVTVSPATSFDNIELEGGDVLSAVPNKVIFVQNNTHVLEVIGLLDDVQNAYWNSAASLSGTLIDPYGNIITTVAFALSGASGAYIPGNFVAVIGGSSFAPPLGRGYTFSFSGTSDWNHAWKLNLLAEVINAPPSVDN